MGKYFNTSNTSQPEPRYNPNPTPPKKYRYFNPHPAPTYDITQPTTTAQPSYNAGGLRMADEGNYGAVQKQPSTMLEAMTQNPEVGTTPLGKWKARLDNSMVSTMTGVPIPKQDVGLGGVADFLGGLLGFVAGGRGAGGVPNVSATEFNAAAKVGQNLPNIARSVANRGVLANALKTTAADVGGLLPETAPSIGKTALGLGAGSVGTELANAYTNNEPVSGKDVAMNAAINAALGLVTHGAGKVAGKYFSTPTKPAPLTSQEAWQGVVDSYRKPSPEAVKQYFHDAKQQELNQTFANYAPPPEGRVGMVTRDTRQADLEHAFAPDMAKLTPQEQQYLTTLRDNGVSPETALNQLESRYNKIVNDEVNYLANAGGKGVQQGGIFRNSDGEVVNAMGRISNNPPWYQEFYAKNGRKPNKSELRDLAIQHLTEGFDSEGGAVPPNEEFVKLQQILPQVKALQEKIGQPEAKYFRVPEPAPKVEPSQSVASPVETLNIEPQPTTATQQPKYFPPPKPADVTLQGGIPGVSEFVKQDVGPAVKGTVGGIRDTFDRVRALIAPRTTVNEHSLNTVMRLKGEREYHLFRLEQQMSDIKTMFTKMPETEQVAFLDRYKRGMAQPTPELQAIADGYKKADDATFNELLKYKPTLAWKENHFRIFWKVIPGAPEAKGFNALFKRPLQGTRGFMKQSTLQDVTEGIQKGGVPVTTNPQRLFEMGQADAMKYITAQKMFGELKDMGFITFVKPGKDIPAGFTRLDDRMAKVYFPTPAGMVQGGEYFVEQNTARILNNYLSKNLIRETELGKGLMWAKNVTTAMELSFSAFHAVFESVDAMASKFGLGFTRMVNQGFVEPINKGVFIPNLREVGKGLKDMATSITGPVEYAKLGNQAIKYVRNKDEFLRTLGGADFIKKVPGADNAIDMLFTGGGKLAVNEDYKIKTIQTMKENWYNKNWIGAGLRAFPALNEQLMKPLFEVYIPRLKVGLFLKEFGQQMEQHNDALLAGKITQEKIAREVWDRVENKLGEMNFDNLFWNHTFKAGMQIMFRSITWKLGSIRGFGSAMVGQAKNFGALRHGKLPALDPGMAWLGGVALSTATLSTIIQTAMTGKPPQELLDYMFPKVGGEDKDGNPNRLSIPTYLKDAAHLLKNPKTYASNSMSGFVSNTLDVMQNKDYFGNYVYNPDDPVWKKFLDVIGYEIPKPFSVTQFQNMAESNAAPREQVMGALGFTKAPRDYTMSRFQIEVANAYSEQIPHAPQTKEQQQTGKAKSDLKRQIFYGSISDEAAKQQAISNGLTTKKGASTFIKNAHLPPTGTMFKYLGKETRDKLLRYATPQEIQKLRDAGLLAYQKAQ